MGVNNYDDRNEGAARASQPAPAPPPSKDRTPLQAESERVRPARPTPPAQSAIAKADARASEALASEALEDPDVQLGSEAMSGEGVTASHSAPLPRSGGERPVSETHSTATGHVTASPRAAAGHTLHIEGTPSRVQPGFIRRRAPHHTQDAIDDIAQDGNSIGEYTHDSNVSIRGNVRGGAFSGMPYRRARSGIDQVKSGKYGRYLEIPKGRRSIFVSQEQQKRRRSALSLVAIIVFLVIAFLIVWRLIASVAQ